MFQLLRKSIIEDKTTINLEMKRKRNPKIQLKNLPITKVVRIIKSIKVMK